MQGGYNICQEEDIETTNYHIKLGKAILCMYCHSCALFPQTEQGVQKTTWHTVLVHRGEITDSMWSIEERYVNDGEGHRPRVQEKQNV